MGVSRRKEDRGREERLPVLWRAQAHPALARAQGRRDASNQPGRRPAQRQSAVKAISREVMRDHLETCVVERIQGGDTEVTAEVMDLFRKFM